MLLILDRIKVIKAALASVTEDELQEIGLRRSEMDTMWNKAKTPPHTEEMHPIMKGVEFNRNK